MIVLVEEDCKLVLMVSEVYMMVVLEMPVLDRFAVVALVVADRYE